MTKIKYEDFGENKDQKIWSVFVNNQQEINTHLLTFFEASELAMSLKDIKEVYHLVVYCPQTLRIRDDSSSGVFKLHLYEFSDEAVFLKAAEFLKEGSIITVWGEKTIGFLKRNDNPDLVNLNEWFYLFGVIPSHSPWDIKKQEYVYEVHEAITYDYIYENNPKLAVEAMVLSMKEGEL